MIRAAAALTLAAAATAFVAVPDQTLPGDESVGDIITTAQGPPRENFMLSTTTTTAPPATTTTHTHKPRVVRQKPARRNDRVQPAERPEQASSAPSGDVRKVSSTAYCLTSRTANGGRGYTGSVAMNGVPFGSVWKVHGGGTYTVNDRIGNSSQFDIWMSSCSAARQYGRRTVTIERIS